MAPIIVSTGNSKLDDKIDEWLDWNKVSKLIYLIYNLIIISHHQIFHVG